MKDDHESITLDTKLVANPSMVLRIEDDDHAILVDPDSGRLRLLNPTAAAIWQLIDGQRTLAEVVGSVEKSFDGFDADAREQVIRFVHSLCSAGAIGTEASLAP